MMRTLIALALFALPACSTTDEPCPDLGAPDMTEHPDLYGAPGASCDGSAECIAPPAPGQGLPFSATGIASTCAEVADFPHATQECCWEYDVPTTPPLHCIYCGGIAFVCTPSGN